MFTPNCDHCNKPNARQRCSQCKCSYYCDSHCQKLNWKATHRTRCIAIKVNKKQEENERGRAINFKRHLESSIENEQYSECAICLGHLKSPIVLPCNHLFCLDCLNMHDMSCDDYLKCPLCRSQLSGSLLEYIRTNAVGFLQRARFEPSGSAERLFLAKLAKSEIEKAINIDRAERYASLLGEVYCCLGENQRALDLLLPILPNFVNNKMAYNNLHMCLTIVYMQMGQFDEAIKYCEVAIDTNEDKTGSMGTLRRSWYDYSICLYETGDYAAAIEAGEYAISLNRHYDNAYDYVALCHKAMGNLDEAVRTMQRASYYETPWIQENVDRVNALLAKYTAERDAAKTKANKT